LEKRRPLQTLRYENIVVRQLGKKNALVTGQYVLSAQIAQIEQDGSQPIGRRQKVVGDDPRPFLILNIKQFNKCFVIRARPSYFTFSEG
jgi:hypothetical protein